MSNQFTDAAAYLRTPGRISPSPAESAIADLLDACAPLADIDWPCETCSGTGVTHVILPPPHPGVMACPHCNGTGQTPSVVRVRKLIAVWEAVHDNDDDRGFGDFLRQVGRDA